jgi:hypothetical protein
MIAKKRIVPCRTPNKTTTESQFNYISNKY